MIKCCIFDLDGTLLFTLNTIRFYLNKTLEKYGLSPLTYEECRNFVGKGARNLLTRAADSRGGIDPLTFESALSEYLADYDKNPYHLTEKYEGIDIMIDELSKMGIKLAVLSNKPNFATCQSVNKFFDGKFSLCFGGRDNIALKPDPVSCFEILSTLSVSAAECAYIGDSEVDVNTGKNMSAALNISALWGFRSREELSSAGAYLFAKNPLEVVDIIKEFNNKNP